MLIYSIVFITGLILGSFLNVVIYRLKELETIVLTRSHCPECKAELKWYDLIPFLSFIMLKTKCRYCGKPISWQYPLVEFGTALMFVLIFWQFGNTLGAYFLMLITLFLIVIFVYDLLHSIIPDEMVYPAIIIALIYLVIGNMANFKLALISALIGGGFFIILYLLGKGKWMGFGDVKLGVLMGLLLPYPKILPALFIAFVLGTIVGLILIVFKKKTIKSEVPFGPFLIIGTYFAIFYGDKILNWYLQLF